MLIHADEQGGRKRVESFVVGKDVSRGERSVWVVEGEKYKASYLLAGEGDGEGRLLISEVSSDLLFWACFVLWVLRDYVLGFGPKLMIRCVDCDPRFRVH